MYTFHVLLFSVSEKKILTTVSEAEKHNPTAGNKTDEEPEPDTTLFVKNLNFDTTDESMRKHFEPCGSIFSCTVARKKDPKNPGQYLSMGFGFVQFWTKKATLTALKELQNSNLDGHDIELKVIIAQQSSIQFVFLFIFIYLFFI